MSIKAMNWVWEHSRTIGNDRLLLLAIADRASDEGMDAWPSIKTLAAKTKLHVRTVQRCLRNIEALGELEIRTSEGRQGTNVYIVRMDVLALQDSRQRRRVPPKRVPATKPPDGDNLPPPGNLPPGDNAAGGGVAPPPPGDGATAGGGVAPPPPDSSGTSVTSCTNTAAEPRLPHSGPVEPVENLVAPMRRDTRLRLAKDPADDGNFAVVAKLAFELSEQGWWESRGERFHITSESELILALKDECARLRISRSGGDVSQDVIYRAAASEWFKRTHPEISGRKAVNE